MSTSASVGRSAPAMGYDFGNKRQYRRIIWRMFRESPYWSPSAHALLMPSSEGDEIEVALRRGFHQSHLHVVDRNPAIVAHLKRRYPLIHTYGVSVERAAERIADAGQTISFANLDLCGPIARPLLQVVEGVALSGVIENGVIAVTMLRGRERAGARELLRDAARVPNLTMDLAREHAVRYALECPVDFDGIRYPALLTHYIRSERYASTAGNQTLLWVIYEVHAAPCACLICAVRVFECVDWSVDAWLMRLAHMAACSQRELIEQGVRVTGSSASARLRRKIHRAGSNTDWYRRALDSARADNHGKHSALGQDYSILELIDAWRPGEPKGETLEE